MNIYERQEIEKDNPTTSKIPELVVAALGKHAHSSIYMALGLI